VLIVKFNGVQDLSAAATSADTISARVPAGTLAGSGPVYVQVNGNGIYSPQAFVVIGAGTYVTDFFPAAGSSSTVITLDGAHFSSARATNVSFSGQSGRNFALLSDTQIQVTAPAGVISGPLTVLSSYGFAYNAITTNFYASPVITGFSPSAGRFGTNGVITGTNFLGATDVAFNRIAAGFSMQNNNSIQVVAPAGVTTGILFVSAPAGSFLTGSNFVVLPNVFGFTPASGSIGSMVTITGANLNAGTPLIQFGGVLAALPQTSSPANSP